MGTDIHAVLQKRDDRHDFWHTIIPEVFPIRDYQFFELLKDTGQHGLPEDFVSFKEDDLVYHPSGESSNKFCMGEYDFGYITLKDFVNMDMLDPPHRFEVEDLHDAYHITIHKASEDSTYAMVEAFKWTFNYMLGYSDLVNYRLVYGFSS